MPTGKVLFSHRKVDGEPFSLATSPDGKAVVAAVADRFELYLWDATTGKPMRTFDWGNAAAMVLSVAWSPDGKRIAAGVYGSLRVWEVETGKRGIECFADPKSDIAAFNEGIVFSSDNQFLAIPGPKGPRLWDATTGKELPGAKGQPRAVIAVSFSPDAKLLASADDQTVLVWDLSVVLRK
jgi:WD40 repeat protein